MDSIKEFIKAVNTLNCHINLKGESMETQKMDRDDTQVTKVKIVQESVVICKKCGNIYRSNIWLKAEGIWNDFGIRYCFICGDQIGKLSQIFYRRKEITLK